MALNRRSSGGTADGYGPAYLLDLYDKVLGCGVVGYDRGGRLLGIQQKSTGQSHPDRLLGMQ